MSEKEAKVKVIRTALDDLPFGDDEGDFGQNEKVTNRLPEGVEEGVVHLPVPLRTGELLRAVRETEEALRRRRQSRRGKPGERTAQQKQDIAAAKARIMEQKNITEAEAHRYLQQLSMETGRTLPETAQMILRFGKL